MGVAALIVVLSVMNGFYDFVRDLLVSVDPHVRIETTSGAGLANPDSLVAIAMQVGGVVSASPFVQGKALVATDGEMDAGKVVLVRGVDAEMFASSGEPVAAGYGSFEMGRKEGVPGVVVGIDLARRLGLTPETSALDASRIGLLSAQSLERSIGNPFGGLFLPRFEVRGVFDLESVSDESRVYIAIDEAQRLFRLGRTVTGVELRVDDIDRAGAVKAQLSRALPGHRIRTWYDLQESLYGVMKLEKWAATLILALIIVVAAFNIAASITMVVIEKRRDIGVLQAMGVSKADIGHIFRIEGLLIGVIGTGAGLAIGLGLSFLQKYLELVPLVGAESFLLSAYPVAVRPMDVVVVSVIGVLLCVAASLYPARRAAAVEPAAAVHIDG